MDRRADIDRRGTDRGVDREKGLGERLDDCSRESDSAAGRGSKWVSKRDREIERRKRKRERERVRRKEGRKERKGDMIAERKVVGIEDGRKEEK